MESSPLSCPSDRILELEASLEETSRTIQQSKMILASIINPYQSSVSHHSILTQKSELTIKVDINMSVSSITDYNRVFPSEAKAPRPHFGNVMANGDKYISERPFLSVSTNVAERQEVGSNTGRQHKTFSFGSNSDTETHEGGTDAKMGNPNNDDAIRIIDDQDQYEGAEQVYSEQGESNGQIDSQGGPIEAENKPCFGWKMAQNQPCQLQQSTQRFKEVKRRLKLSDSFRQWTPEKKDSIQGTTSTKQKVKTPSLFTYDPEFEHCQGKQSETQASLSPSQRSASKMQLIKYFTKSPSQKAVFGQIKCDKFRREVELDRKLRLISQAVKTPGIKRHFSLEQLYDLQALFSKTRLPEYKWAEFISQKVRSQPKFEVLPSSKRMSL